MKILSRDLHPPFTADRLKAGLASLWTRLLKSVRYHPEKRYMRSR